MALRCESMKLVNQLSESVDGELIRIRPHTAPSGRIDWRAELINRRLASYNDHGAVSTKYFIDFIAAAFSSSCRKCSVG